MIDTKWEKIVEQYRGYYITDNGHSYLVYDKDENYKCAFSCTRDCREEIDKFNGDFHEKDRDCLKEFATIFINDMKEVLSSNYRNGDNIVGDIIKSKIGEYGIKDILKILE